MYIIALSTPETETEMIAVLPFVQWQGRTLARTNLFDDHAICVHRSANLFPGRLSIPHSIDEGSPSLR